MALQEAILSFVLICFNARYRNAEFWHCVFPIAHCEVHYVKYFASEKGKCHFGLGRGVMSDLDSETGIEEVGVVLLA